MKRDCENCGEPFDAKRKTAKYCSGKCRVQAQRGTDSGTDSGTVVAFGILPATAPDPPPVRGSVSLEAAARAELDAVGRAETLAGGVVLALARRIDSADDDTGSGFAALTKELRAALAVAVAGAEQEDDPVDQVRKQRERKQQNR